MVLVFFVVMGMIVAKLFYLQVIRHGYYMDKALADHQGYTELESRRGEIFIQDYHSDADFKVATNTTLDNVFADPFLIEDPVFVADKLYSLLFKEEEAMAAELERQEAKRAELPADLVEEEIAQIVRPKTVDELELEFRNEIIAKLSQQQRPQVLIVENAEKSLRSQVEALGISGVEVVEKSIYAYPPQIRDPRDASIKLAPILDVSPQRMETILAGNNRYTILASKISPKVSDQIREMMEEDPLAYRGIGFEDKDYRYYPESQLASQIVGFLNSENEGVYGIEEYFDDLLKGEVGVFKTKLDAFGKQITVGNDTIIKPAEDGSNIYLTIERSIQMEAERIIKNTVENTGADSGELLVMNPYTGELLAMAQYPIYNPNEFWTALDTEPVFLEELVKEDIFNKNRDVYETIEDVVLDDTTMANEIERRMIELNYASGKELYFSVNESNYKEIRVLPTENEETGVVTYETYVNGVGPAAYRVRSVVDIYEPGSIFKPISMAGAIDDELVTPNTTMQDDGPVKVDEFTIDNAQSKHYGLQTMTNVLENSNNVGMAWLSQEMGRGLLGSYIKKFGFGRRTDIQMSNEKSGTVKSYATWADSELVTASFGQGLTVTPVQMITAFSALANGGLLMEPTIVKRIEYSDGKEETFEPTIVRRVISKKAADTMAAMLESVVSKGQAKSAQVEGYTVAGKTGTAQTYRGGVPLKGAGTTVASFAGFAPASDPQFVILVKVDKPRSAEWGSVVAAPAFAEMAEYILRYLNIGPDKV